MKVKLRIFSALAMIVVGVSTSLPVAAKSNSAAVFGSLDFVANIETIGVAVSGTSLPSTAQLSYRQTGESVWRPGYQLIRINDGRLIGSLFNLTAATSYDVKVSDGITEINGTVSTQPDQLSFSPSSVLHVDDSAPPGGNGSAAAPFQTIQEGVDHAVPGTQVLVADGTYRESITFPASGAPGNWIQVKSAGNAAILDSADRLSGNIWTAYTTGHVFFTRVDGPVAYLARDGKRYYQYDDRNGLMQAIGHGGVAMNEGWFYETSTQRLYVRSLDAPSGHTWQLPRLNHAFDPAAQNWIWIEGFEIGFYGTTTNGCGVCTLNVSHLVIRNNKIHNMQLGIFTYWTGTPDQGNDTRIEGNEVSDPKTADWPWASVKASFMEGTAILVRGHIGAIVRDNTVHDFFNGIFTGSSATGVSAYAEIAFDTDVYHNYIHHITDDALEPEGACTNHRFRENTIDRSYVGFSIAPVTVGPTWFLRNVFSNFTGRGIKFADASSGKVFVFHNTGWTSAANINGADLITSIHNVVMRNNIFQSMGYSINEVPTGSTANDWNHDNWYTTKAVPHFKWENVNYNTVAALCTARGLECNGHEGLPGFTNPAGGNFTLLPSSPNIDRGVLIPGINDDYIGNAPDLGAFELTADPIPTVLSSVRASSNPTNAASVNFTVTFSEPVSGVDLAAPFDDFKLVPSLGLSGTSVTGVTPVSSSVYSVSVNTGSGNGTLRLDVNDNDSIVDSRGNPLGGTGAGSGNFSSGETYTINKSITTLVTATFKSLATYDGWLLESGETTNIANKLDRGAVTIQVGDDLKDKQYRGILSFNTSSLPDNAVIVSVQVKVKRQGIVGTDPFSTHGPLLSEICRGAFSNNVALQLGDFAAAASTGSTKDAFAAQTSTWYAAQLSDANLAFVNKLGATQFRLAFTKDDNDDLGSDYVKFYSGNSTSANVPQLIVVYFIP
jgi:hypothetical protein